MIFSTGEIYWMTGVIAVGVVYLLFAIAWGKDAKDED